MKIWLQILTFLICINALATGYNPEDTLKRINYTFYINNNKVQTEFDGYSLSFKDFKTKANIHVYYSVDSTLSSKQITFINTFQKDSVRFHYNKSGLTDSCVWDYDKFGREIKYVLFQLSDESTLTWIYEYQDSISDEKTITTITRYRIDKAKNYLDTCCKSQIVQITKDSKVDQEIETDEFGDSTETNFTYDNNGLLLNTEVKMNFGFVKNIPAQSNGQCYNQEFTEFPDSLIHNKIVLNSFLTTYLEKFNNRECKPETLVLNSIDKKIEMNIIRADCHSANTGRIAIIIKK